MYDLTHLNVKNVTIKRVDVRGDQAVAQAAA